MYFYTYRLVSVFNQIKFIENENYVAFRKVSEISDLGKNLHPIVYFVLLNYTFV